MTLNKKNLPALVLFVLLGLLVGSLAWEVLERIVRVLGLELSLTVEEPIRLFDLYVLAVSLRANPGTVLGALAGVLLFRRL